MGLSTWTASQQAVLKEIGVPLLRLRSDDSNQSTDRLEVIDSDASPDIRGWGASGRADSIAAVEATRWYTQLRQFLGNVDFQVMVAPAPTRIHAPGQIPLDLHQPSLDAAAKRALYALARRALSGSR